MVGFTSTEVLKGQAHRDLRVFGNPPSIQFALDMLMLWWFGGELSGRLAGALWLAHGGIYLLPPYPPSRSALQAHRGDR